MFGLPDATLQLLSSLALQKKYENIQNKNNEIEESKEEQCGEEE
jgi:hypothetical protein